MFRLVNPVQNYAWGSPEVIPGFLRLEPDGQPVAEVWMGAHPSASSVVLPLGFEGRAGSTLRELLEAEPALLGADSSLERLPFLVKFLAAQRPLSLQVHPTLEHARDRFAKEEAIGASASERNYQDPNHKPELLVAMVPTVALAGFRSVKSSLAALDRLSSPALVPVRACLQKPGSDASRVRAAFAACLDLSDDDVAGVITELESHAGELESLDPLAVAAHLAGFYGDAGVVGSLLLNAVALSPGEGLYINAGIIHAYVRGFGLEVMASSDNVLRAGLTPKRVDRDELFAVADFEPSTPDVVRGQTCWREYGVGQWYDTPADDFALRIANLLGCADAKLDVAESGPRLAICMDGLVEVESDLGRAALKRGDALFAGDTDGELRASGTGRLAVVAVRGK